MNKGHLEDIINNIKEAVKDFNLQDGDMLSHSDENHRLNISPYRVTMEIRFPQGIKNLDK